MPDNEKGAKQPKAEAEKGDHPPEALDRQAYLRTVRQEMLKKLGLPEKTRPEQVGLLLAIKAGLDGLKKSGQ